LEKTYKTRSETNTRNIYDQVKDSYNVTTNSSYHHTGGYKGLLLNENLPVDAKILTIYNTGTGGINPHHVTFDFMKSKVRVDIYRIYSEDGRDYSLGSWELQIIWCTIDKHVESKECVNNKVAEFRCKNTRKHFRYIRLNNTLTFLRGNNEFSKRGTCIFEFFGDCIKSNDTCNST
jgi:hypothetical protein